MLTVIKPPSNRTTGLVKTETTVRSSLNYCNLYAMHLSSLEKMRDFTARHLADAADRPLEILDLGSADIGGIYARFFDNPNRNYRGVDLAPGPNIHVVLSDPYNWRELPTHCADVFISGQTFEHIEFFWLTMRESRAC